MDLELHYAHDDNIGYGRMGIGIAKYLQRMGVTLHKTEGTCSTAVWMCPPNHIRRWVEGQRPMVVTMWEASHLPAGMRENLHEFSVVFVPSRQNEELFSRYHDSVVRMPLGIDPEIWHFKPRRPVERYFNFFAPGQSKRKGTDIAAYAFKAAFPHNEPLDPEPRLILKAFVREDIHDERFEFVNGVLSSGDEMALYEHAHCTVGLARGEGFGLMPIQAIAQGCPTILSDAHGHADYAHLALRVSCSTSSAQKFLYGDAGDWWEPNFDETVDWMREVYNRYEPYKTAAREMSSLCLEQFSWRNSAQIMADTIGESHLLTDDEKGIEHLSQAMLYRMEVDRYADPFIAGISYRFERDHMYWVPADVRRVMWDAGFVTEESMKDEEGRLVDADMNLGIC